MGRIPKIENEKKFVGMELDEELWDRVTVRCKEKGISKREYVKNLIMADNGLRYVPGHYEEIV